MRLRWVVYSTAPGHFLAVRMLLASTWCEECVAIGLGRNDEGSRER